MTFSSINKQLGKSRRNQARYLDVSDDHRNTKSKSTNIQRRGGGSHEMMKMKLQTNLDLLI